MNFIRLGSLFVLRLVTAVFLVSFVAACTPWPQEGRGGIAERRPIENSELMSLSDRLQLAIERGSRASYAAQTTEAELQLVRTRRTWQAGFVEDYITDFQTLEVLVQDIESHVRNPERVRIKRNG